MSDTGLLDSRLDWAYDVLAALRGVLGPTLGGGFVPAGIGSGLGRVGGGTGPAILGVRTDPFQRDSVRQDFAVDFSTPTRIAWGPPLPPEVDFGGVGGGFSDSLGLSALAQSFNHETLVRELGGMSNPDEDLRGAPLGVL